MNDSISVCTWNLEWARSGTPKATEILLRLHRHKLNVACLTETDVGFPLGIGFFVSSHEDYGYSAPPWRRKVLLWSENPWTQVDVVGDASLPGGRFVSAVTETGIDPIRFTGVCIPWTDAHVRSGNRNRERWEDHLLYLVALQNFLDQIHGPHVVLGDYNQAIPRKRAPKKIHEQLLAAFGDKFSFATKGPVEEYNKLLIDHVAHTNELRASRPTIISNQWVNNKRLSDHVGVVVKVATCAPNPR